MSTTDIALLQRIQALIHKAQDFSDTAQKSQAQTQATHTIKCMTALGDAILRGKAIFGVEPWHVIDAHAPLSAPGEYLLRLQNGTGTPLSPYPAIMSFYENGMTADIDVVLFLCALKQFLASDESQISVNISARSLCDADFIRTALERLEQANLAAAHKTIIIEVHETTQDIKMSKDVLKMFRRAGVMFALDDAGLSMGDVMRMAEFEDMADFIKLDRHSVCARPDRPDALDHLISLVSSLFPHASIVAEGAKSTSHARALKASHPQLHYVQGLYLPTNRSVFEAEWRAAEKRVA